MKKFDRMTRLPDRSILMLKVVLVFMWSVWLVWGAMADGSRYVSVDFLLGFCAMAAVFGLERQGKGEKLSRREAFWISGAAWLLSAAALLANHGIIYFDSILEDILLVFYLWAGFIAIRAMLQWCLIKCGCYAPKSIAVGKGWSKKKIFLSAFCSIVAIDFLALFTIGCPGTLTPDSISQMTQLLSGTYTNHHPFYHTMIIKGCVEIGLFLFGDINRAVCCYSVFQIGFMASIFAYAVVTAYELSGSKRITVVCGAWFALYPVHILYSFTMWKDVVFAGVMLLFITSLLRYWMRQPSLKKTNGVLLVLSSFGICLLRSNGFFAFALSTLLFGILLGKKYKKLTLCFVMVLLASAVLKGPVLQSLDVRQPDTIESLSIPAQQIARVAAEGGEFTAEQRDLLCRIVDVDRLGEVYVAYISDPVKALVRETDNQQYLVDHKLEYLKLWLEIGLDNPVVYLKAWIDQTVGYWFSGYEYWIVSNGVFENELGITALSDKEIRISAQLLFEELFLRGRLLPVLSALVSTGWINWIIFGIAVVWFAKRQFEQAFLSIPILATVASLMVATPVAFEYRYIYSAFTCIALILTVYLCGIPQRTKE